MNMKIALACLISSIWIQHALCVNWTCTCSSSAYQGNQSYALGTNCSTSCNCNPESASGESWKCICAADKFPEIATKCFSACNCTSGSVNETLASKKHMSSKIVVVIILLLCIVILTMFGFFALALCYIYRKEKFLMKSSVFSSDRDTSCNSDTNLIVSRKTTLNPEFRVTINPLAGCFHTASFLFRSKPGSIPSVIYQFTYSELENATDKFSEANLVGLGGSSQVYRGQIKDGRIVAVKRLKTPGGHDADAIFLTEIELLSRLHHYHVVPLLGYCSESQGKQAERLLVFEYMPNGNLRDCLDGSSGMNIDWSSRIAIALGAARGLEYLHEAAAPRILHRDVKSTNILLDGNSKAKIIDLGMAKRLRADGIPSCSSSPARMQGTFGYFAPEYAIVGRASLKSDVFSFGVVLLELITGRQPVHRSSNKCDESLVIWASPRLQDSRRVIMELPDPNLKGKFPEEEVQIMAYLAKECLLMDPDSRPTMSEVVQILSTIAPQRSTRRNISVDLFQRSDTQHIYDKQVVGPADTEEIMPTLANKWSDRYSVPVEVERTMCIQNDDQEICDTISNDYVDRLILLSSKARSWRVNDDEIVDLTEPRFESFCMANVKTSL